MPSCFARGPGREKVEKGLDKNRSSAPRWAAGGLLLRKKKKKKKKNNRGEQGGEIKSPRGEQFTFQDQKHPVRAEKKKSPCASAKSLEKPWFSGSDCPSRGGAVSIKGGQTKKKKKGPAVIPKKEKNQEKRCSMPNCTLETGHPGEKNFSGKKGGKKTC